MKILKEYRHQIFGVDFKFKIAPKWLMKLLLFTGKYNKTRINDDLVIWKKKKKKKRRPRMTKIIMTRTVREGDEDFDEWDKDEHDAYEMGKSELLKWFNELVQEYRKNESTTYGEMAIKEIHRLIERKPKLRKKEQCANGEQ